MDSQSRHEEYRKAITRQLATEIDGAVLLDGASRLVEISQIDEGVPAQDAGLPGGEATAVDAVAAIDAIVAAAGQEDGGPLGALAAGIRSVQSAGADATWENRWYAEGGECWVHVTAHAAEWRLTAVFNAAWERGALSLRPSPGMAQMWIADSAGQASFYDEAETDLGQLLLPLAEGQVKTARATAEVALRQVLGLDEDLAVRVLAGREDDETWQATVRRLLGDLLYPPGLRPPGRDAEIVTVTAPDGRTLEVAVRLMDPDGPTVADIQAEVGEDVEAAADLWAAGLRSRQPDGHGSVWMDTRDGGGWDVLTNDGEVADIDAEYYDMKFPPVGVHGEYTWIDDDTPHAKRQEGTTKWWPSEETRRAGWGAGWYAA